MPALRCGSNSVAAGFVAGSDACSHIASASAAKRLFVDGQEGSPWPERKYNIVAFIEHARRVIYAASSGHLKERLPAAPKLRSEYGKYPLGSRPGGNAYILNELGVGNYQTIERPFWNAEKTVLLALIVVYFIF